MATKVLLKAIKSGISKKLSKTLSKDSTKGKKNIKADAAVKKTAKAVKGAVKKAGPAAKASKLAKTVAKAPSKTSKILSAKAVSKTDKTKKNSAKNADGAIKAKSGSKQNTRDLTHGKIKSSQKEKSKLNTPVLSDESGVTKRARGRPKIEKKSGLELDVAAAQTGKKRVVESVALNAQLYGAASEKGPKGSRKKREKNMMSARELSATRSRLGASVLATSFMCREVSCELNATTGQYCRMHYIKNWKKIKRKEQILREGKLEGYIHELLSKYPEKYLEALKQDLMSDKEFTKVITDLEIEESVDDFDGVETESADGIIDTIKRDFEDDGDVF